MDRLTPKQEEVVRLMAKGLTNGQIAERMGVSLAGAKWHVSEVLSKLGVASRDEAVMHWRAENGVGSRMRGFLGMIFGPKVIVGTAAAGGLAGVFAAATLVMGGEGGGGTRELAVDETLPALTPDNSDGFVYPGQCDTWSQTYEGIPLCGPMDDDEVRFRMAIDGARVTIEGLVGGSIDRIELELADGAQVHAMAGPPNADSDDGGGFTIEGTYEAAPAGLVFVDLHGAPVANINVASNLAGMAWPTAAPPVLPADNTFTQESDGSCVLWHFVGNDYSECVDGNGGKIGGMHSGTEDGGFYLVGLAPDETERIVVGFDDGTLVESYLTHERTADGVPFLAHSNFADAGRKAVTMTSVADDGSVAVEDLQARIRLPQPNVSDSLPFTDGDVLIAANRHGCYNLHWPSGDRGSGWLGGCVHAIGVRNPAGHPIVGTGVSPSRQGTVWAYAVVNPQVAAVEVVDAEGNSYREEAQTIPSSPHGLKFVFFDREVATPAMDLRALGATGEVLEVQEGVLGIGVAPAPSPSATE